jgi:hypothetical protein
VHWKLKVFCDDPVFTIVKVSACPEEFSGRDWVVVPSGVTCTPYVGPETTGTLYHPLSAALTPLALSASIPVPAAPTLYCITTVVLSPPAKVTLAGFAEQITGLPGEHWKLNWFCTVPVFLTVKLSEWP